MKQIISRLLIAILVILALASVYIFIYYYNNQDVNDVKVEGYVLDSSNSQPLKDVKVTVINDRYENDNGHKNYDEYLGQDKIELRTDTKGYYSIVLKKSAYVYIYKKKIVINLLRKKENKRKNYLLLKHI
ncbi:hypothetical protein [Chryseobacterium sp. Bi04]|uniref:hypothetical protein n=1 Tax=Chryseobacterium sp. Bi04 TaxID=2822345 RepID=UPI001D3E1D99|nr:hypothetical protein [Chryseobacterium sp. Bi04]CAH0293421.1 hypothetical protein SRABI04_04413 [Chryseobacterium sp. Bi04]